jgi:alanyl-tRNA synthetase
VAHQPALTSAEIRRRFLAFFAERGHAIIPAASLVPREDPTTLFNGSGVQPLVPYLLGADHPAGKRLANSQPCFRAEDVDEVGDSRHTTFFEMLGNWSMGDYFKAEQLPWLFEFLVDHLRLDPRRLYVTVFQGAPEYGIERDDEAVALWRSLFANEGINAPVVVTGPSSAGSELGMDGGRIFVCDSGSNWWSRAGRPESMPEGEPGGPDSEVFFCFEDTEHDPAFGDHCHVHCDCGRLIEIGNSVFMQYVRTADGFESLRRRNVDFGGGLERLAMACQGTPDVFRIDLLWPLAEAIADRASVSYEEASAPLRVIADHTRALVFLAAAGVEPSNTMQGYVMRRFARRTLRQGLLLGLQEDLLAPLVPTVAGLYATAYPELSAQADRIAEDLAREERTFRKTLLRGTREFAKLAGDRPSGDAVFTLFDTYGFPPELSVEEARRNGVAVEEDWEAVYQTRMADQRERSRTMSAGVFKGGLADHSAAATRLHTATHLLYRALRLVLGDHVVQRGSHIAPERLRFDFSHPRKVSPEELAKIEDVVNDAIARDLPVTFRELPVDEAFAEGALGAFGEKYGETVIVYTVGDPEGDWYSKEVCGGPHVARTGELSHFRILKEESSSAGVRRIRATLQPT